MSSDWSNGDALADAYSGMWNGDRGDEGWNFDDVDWLWDGEGIDLSSGGVSATGQNHTHSHDTESSTSPNLTESSASTTHLPPQLRSTNDATGASAATHGAVHSGSWLDRVAPRQSSFGYLPEQLFGAVTEGSDPTTPSTITTPVRQTNGGTNGEEMAPNTRLQTARRSVVDLTEDTGPLPDSEIARPRSLKRAAQAETPGRPSKKSRPSLRDIEEVDLSEEIEAPSAEAELLQAQQEATIKAQQELEKTGAQRIGQRQCIICMENYTNATTTACGHIYCHECLTRALMAGEKNSDRGVGTCPVCRKVISRRNQRNPPVIPISFMKKSAFKGKAWRDKASSGR